jgi:hypothetical protein
MVSVWYAGDRERDTLVMMGVDMSLTAEDLGNISTIVDTAVKTAVGGLATKTELHDAVSGLAAKDELRAAISNLATKDDLREMNEGIRADMNRMEARLITSIGLLERVPYRGWINMRGGLGVWRRR